MAAFPYHKVLIIGATSGIGRALAARIASTTPAAHVIASGRRQENLDSLAKEHPEQISALRVDVADTASLPAFVKEVTAKHADLDCIVLNAGVQRSFDFSSEQGIDMDKFRHEALVNYLNVVYLTDLFVPFFLKKNHKVALMYTTSNLATVPMVRAPGYSGSKAALHAFIICLREQLRDTNVKIVELMPPAVQTELHNERNQPDLKGPRNFGMPLDEFTDKAYEGLVKGEERVMVGSFDRSKEFEDWRSATAQMMWSRMKGH